MTTRGHCHCGATRWEFEGDPAWAGYCHCGDCRRNCAAPVSAWLGVSAASFRWTGDATATRESAPGVIRHFCATCGTPMALEARHYPDAMNLYLPTLEDPATVRPQFHLNYQSRLPWLEMADDLPRYEGRLSDKPKEQGADGA
ncbi:MAG: GFA family protein [Roseovarius sp.]